MTTRAAIKSAEVTITSDLICPWCWVGLRKLQEASKDANVKANITWKPFMLRPGLPEDGMPKGGEPASRVPHHLKQAGRSVGIDFTSLTDRTPNTEVFHATIKFLQDDVKVDAPRAARQRKRRSRPRVHRNFRPQQLAHQHDAVVPRGYSDAGYTAFNGVSCISRGERSTSLNCSRLSQAPGSGTRKQSDASSRVKKRDVYSCRKG